MITKVLLIGCGDIALRLAGRLPADAFQCYGLRRHVERLPSAVRSIAWDLNRGAAGLAERIAGFDVVVITLVPNTRDAAGYRQAYVENLQKIIAGLEAGLGGNPKLVLLVSSTSVYGQHQTEWVDEDSLTEPANFRGRAVLQSEQLLRKSSLNSCVVRFSGIYGPGREHLLTQVRRGTRGERDEDFTNRIHTDDCAGVLAHLIQRKLNGETVESLYLASDCEPVRLVEIKQWLAKRMALSVEFVDGNQIGPLGGKRCSSKRLLESGYLFKYPTFREGYAEILGSHCW
jgi:nucleoside-diphosphate-sugar epimerase